MKTKCFFAVAGIAAAASAAPLNIDKGRQLFVDDHVIGATNGVVRYWNKPVKAPAPVVRPTDERNGRRAGSVMATDGGLWWDPTIGKYRLWYETEWMGHLSYAESVDGLNWEYPDLGRAKVKNRVFSDSEEKINKSLDSWTVFPDYKAANPYANWKLFISEVGYPKSLDKLFESSDGRTFRPVGPAGYSGDRSTCYYDAILGKWVFSLRDYRPNIGRCRRFHVQDEFKSGENLYWVPCREKMPDDAKYVNPEPWKELEFKFAKNEFLYNFDAVPYESIMLGMIEVLHNIPGDNRACAAAGMPKQTSLRFAFSRDGRNYSAAPDSALKPEGWGSGKWDSGYLSPMGGICTVSDDELRFYYSAMRGDARVRVREDAPGMPSYKWGMHYNGAIGYATMRRDGFAGMVADGEGVLTTRDVEFSGGHLFVNAECLGGEVSAEVIGADGKVLPGFSYDDCTGMKYADSTKREFRFKGGNLSVLAGKPVRIRIRLRCATLYSFWVSKSPKGESGGYVAAGGPQYPGLKDTGKPCGE